MPSTPIALAEVRDLCASGAARAIREAADLSLSEMALDVGVSAPTLSCWERGMQRPTGTRALGYRALLLKLARQRRVANALDPHTRGRIDFINDSEPTGMGSEPKERDDSAQPTPA
jgi:transcriptional regulator with XRE-family HTH domain